MKIRSPEVHTLPSSQHKPKKSRKIKPLNRKAKLFVYLLLAGLDLAIFFTAGGFTFAATQ
ncbi:MAG: hypothetical protein ACK2UM_12100 [Anaerolineales bacterium]